MQCLRFYNSLCHFLSPFLNRCFVNPPLPPPCLRIGTSPLSRRFPSPPPAPPPPIAIRGASGCWPVSSTSYPICCSICSSLFPPQNIVHSSVTTATAMAMARASPSVMAIILIAIPQIVSTFPPSPPQRRAAVILCPVVCYPGAMNI